MDRATRQRLAYEVQRRQQRGDSERGISRALGIHRNTVRGLLDELAARREQGETALEREVRVPVRRPSRLDPFAGQIQTWLEQYPDLTAVRLHEKLVAEGFAGGYTIVREHLKAQRGQRKPQRAFEVVDTPPGLQCQFDWSPYVLPGCGDKVQLWGCTLSWSRARAYEAWDNSRQTTILVCLKNSFEAFGGVPAQWVTDSMPGVVDRWECNQPLLNARFVDFAAYYGATMDIAPRGCARYKGKKERTFRFVEENLLNGRRFSSLSDFREVLAWWVREKAMARPHPTSGRSLHEMLAAEQPHLKPLPARPYDTREVVMRLVDTYGYVQHQTNFYRVPDSHIGALLYLCVDVERIEIFDRGVHRVAGYARLPDGAGQRQGQGNAHRRRYDVTLLTERLAAWGEVAETFAHRLARHKRYAGPELSHILSLQLSYAAEDIVAALAHAMDYDAFDARAVERILKARFQPRALDEQIAHTSRDQMQALMRSQPVAQRPLSHYAALRAGDPPPHPGDATDDQDPRTPLL